MGVHAVSRWTYVKEEVTVGGNSQTVRKLTSGERAAFAQSAKKIAAGEMEATELPFVVAKFGCIDPSLTREDLEGMPPDLLDACVRKILELSGMGDDPEKKEPDPATLTLPQTQQNPS